MLSPLMLGGCDAPVEDADERGATDYEWGVSEQAIPCDEQQAIEGYECETADGQQGLQQCLLADGEEYWTECQAEPDECVPSSEVSAGCLIEYCAYDGVSFEWYENAENCIEPEDITPLVLNFDDAPVGFAPMVATPFELAGQGSCMSTAWPTSPWLALDRDADGMIRSGAELFGSATAMQSGGFAQHGFSALAELDSNFDGRIDAQDERFSELVLWNDLDDDRIGAYAELRPLSESGVVSIDLDFSRRLECDAMGNCGEERASFEYRRGDDVLRGEVVDVHLMCQ